jgi:hypothetical protein
MPRRRSVLAGIAALSGSTLLAGCGGGGDSSGELSESVIHGNYEVVFTNYFTTDGLQYYDNDTESTAVAEPDNDAWLSAQVTVRNVAEGPVDAFDPDALDVEVGGETFRAATTYPFPAENARIRNSTLGFGAVGESDLPEEQWTRKEAHDLSLLADVPTVSDPPRLVWHHNDHTHRLKPKFTPQ